MDDSNVVPYNRKLLLRFAAHINVEYCGWNMVIKYLFKYISKGVDRIRFTINKRSDTQSNISEQSEKPVDEVKNFVDGRYICPHEAAWRIFEFPIHNRNPTVQVLAVHLENMQRVTFVDSATLENVVNNHVAGRTTLTEWLFSNVTDRNNIGRHLTYVDYVSNFRWDNARKCWIPRTQNRTPTVGRLVYVHPSCGEAFYLCMLPNHQRGCQTFTDIRTINGETFPTYRAACDRLGLLQCDNEWSYALAEAASWATSKELQSLFVHMLLFCEVSNPLSLWGKNGRLMSDDIPDSIRSIIGLHMTNISDEDLQNQVLFELELMLNGSSSSTSLHQYDLPMPPTEFESILTNRLLLEERNYDKQALAAQHELLMNGLHVNQKVIYDSIMDAATHNNQLLLFVYGHGGSGKTYLWTTIICALRSIGKIVLAVAASGIASLLLPSGRTAHSRFKIPLNLTDDSICHISKKRNLLNFL